MKKKQAPMRTLSIKRPTSRGDESVPLLRNAVTHSAKPSEVYGFVGSIGSLVAFAVYLAWAYLPEAWLHAVGITYYPSRYWAVALPAYFMVTIVFILSVYISLNYIATPPPESLNTLYDEFTRPLKLLSVSDEKQPIPPISDIPITEINALLFGASENMPL